VRRTERWDLNGITISFKKHNSCIFIISSGGGGSDGSSSSSINAHGKKKE